MKLYKNIFMIFILFLLYGCDLLLQPEENKIKKEKAKLAARQKKIFGQTLNYPEVEINKIIRADLFTVVLQGQTQNIHLSGILAPTTQSSRYNRFLEKKFKFDHLSLRNIARESVGYVKEVTDDRASLLKVISSKTNDAGVIIIEGDILFADNSSLCEKLIGNGFAVVYTEPDEKLFHLENIEKKARNSEKGLWNVSLDLLKRFRVESDFEFKTLSVQTDKVRAQTASATASGTASKNAGHVLESHRNFEKIAEIIVKIDASKPVQRTYRGVAEYTFYTKESIGKRQQEVSLAAPRGTLKRDGSYKPLSSSDKTKKRRDERKIRDYNKKVHGQTIYTDALSFDNSVDFELSSLSTNLIFTSKIVNFTESKKAGVKYETGTQYVGYDLDVWIEDTLVYSHKLKR